MLEAVSKNARQFRPLEVTVYLRSDNNINAYCTREQGFRHRSPDHIPPSALIFVAVGQIAVAVAKISPLPSLPQIEILRVISSADNGWRTDGETHKAAVDNARNLIVKAASCSHAMDESAKITL